MWFNFVIVTDKGLYENILNIIHKNYIFFEGNVELVGKIPLNTIKDDINNIMLIDINNSYILIKTILLEQGLIIVESSSSSSSPQNQNLKKEEIIILPLPVESSQTLDTMFNIYFK